MNDKTKPSRRDFLRLLTAGGVTAVGGYILSEYAPWLDYEEQVVKTWGVPSSSTPLMTLVYYATLAANGHNTQPWKFAIKDNAIEIHPDYSRRLPVVDPHDRELWISLGCSLENLLVAARASGFTSEVTYPNREDFIHVQLTADTPQDSPLFGAIPLRQNTRSAYDGRLIKNQDLDQLQALQLEPGVGLKFATNPSAMETYLEYVNLGNLAQYADTVFVDELIEWLRFNKKEALSSLDGLYSICSGNPQVPRWIGQIFVNGTKPQQQADADAAKFRTSPVAVVVASEMDDKVSWVRTGQVYERLALKMTSLNIKSAFLNQPIEISVLREQFKSAIGLGSSLPQLLLRFGYAESMPRSLRRPVEQVLI
jgi:hypothetical protein